MLGVLLLCVHAEHVAKEGVAVPLHEEPLGLAPLSFDMLVNQLRNRDKEFLSAVGHLPAKLPKGNHDIRKDMARLTSSIDQMFQRAKCNATARLLVQLYGISANLLTMGNDMSAMWRRGYATLPEYDPDLTEIDQYGNGVPDWPWAVGDKTFNEFGCTRRSMGFGCLFRELKTRCIRNKTIFACNGQAGVSRLQVQ
jgi:hypothetical protein